MTSHFIEVSRLEKGLKTDIRRLSAKREWLSGFAVASVCALISVACLVVAVSLMRLAGRVVFAPQLLGAFALVGGTTTWWLVRAAKRSARHVRLGPNMKNDGFAPVAVDLVRRLPGAANVFELGVVSGMSGELHSERQSIPLEAIAPKPGASPVYRRIEAGDTAIVRLGPETYLVERRNEVEALSSMSLSRALADMPRRWVVAGLAASLVLAFYTSIPTAGAVIQLRPPIVSATKASGWEAEKELRLEAQLQAPSLYQCFDKLPLACQRPGYVGVGLSLTKEGEIRSHWISSSTYNESCPVTACMGEIVALWQFNPLPQPMRVVLPVQVLRTSKPLVAPVKVASAVEASSALVASTP